MGQYYRSRKRVEKKKTLLVMMAERHKIGPKRQLVERAATELFRELFERACSEPYTWQSVSESLMRAARTLLPVIKADLHAVSDPTQEKFEPPMVPIYMLLAGLAIENLAKAIYVTQNGATQGTDRLAQSLKTHSLLDLIDRAGIEFDPNEAYLIERLETFVKWAGRYPIPGKLEDYLPRATPLGGSGPLTNFTSGDPEMVEELIRRLTATLELRRNGTT